MPDHSLAAQDQEVMERILQKRIPDKLRRNTELDPLVNELKQEVVGDYDFSVRKSIGEWLIMEIQQFVQGSIKIMLSYKWQWKPYNVEVNFVRVVHLQVFMLNIRRS